VKIFIQKIIQAIAGVVTVAVFLKIFGRDISYAGLISVVLGIPLGLLFIFVKGKISH
jgi:hypothetical protein